MTDLLDHAIERVRALPPERQDDLARLLLEIAGEEQSTHHLTDDEVASFAHSRAQAARGEFASDADVAAVWAKYDH